MSILGILNTLCMFVCLTFDSDELRFYGCCHLSLSINYNLSSKSLSYISCLQKRLKQSWIFKLRCWESPVALNDRLRWFSIESLIKDRYFVKGRGIGIAKRFKIPALFHCLFAFKISPVGIVHRRIRFPQGLKLSFLKVKTLEIIE